MRALITRPGGLMPAGWMLALMVWLLLLTACGGGDGEDGSASVSPTASALSPSALSSSASVRATSTPPAPSSTAPATTATSAPATAATTGPSAGLSAIPTLPTLPTVVDQGIVEGGDVSWPQCPRGMGIPQKQGSGAPMPLWSARFVVLGLTNGPGFTPNPCLRQQVEWVKSRHLMAGAYSVISWPSTAQLRQYGDQGPYPAITRAGRLANAGYAQALFNIATMKTAGLTSPAVWLDVEPVPDFDWPADVQANAAVVRGAAKAYAAKGYQVGVYSTTALWTRVVGTLALGLREWRAAGHTSRAEALRRCESARMIQGGTAVITQWVGQERDRDVTCPGESASLPLWFHQY